MATLTFLQGSEGLAEGRHLVLVDGPLLGPGHGLGLLGPGEHLLHPRLQLLPLRLGPRQPLDVEHIPRTVRVLQLLRGAETPGDDKEDVVNNIST